jgi:diguanylate cyclase (GGDEF)-like protein
MKRLHPRRTLRPRRREHNHALNLCRQDILEQIAQNTTLEETLSAIARMAQLNPRTGAGILIPTAQGVRLVASPDFPPTLAAAFNAAQVPDIPHDIQAHTLQSAAGEQLGAILLCRHPSNRLSALEAEHLSVAQRLAVIAIEQHNMVEELIHRAQYDSLTNLCNRLTMENRLSQIVQRSRSAPKTVGVLYLGLDRFRLVNDVLGHRTGDELLRQVGDRLRGAVRDSDIVARSGGDEFVVIIPAMARPGEVEAVAEKLRNRLAESFDVHGHQLCLTVSIGGCSGAPGADPEVLQRDAYTALHHAKRQGRNRTVMFDPAMGSAPPQRLEMERHLRSAIRHQELELHYQPQIELRTGQLAGVEALLRWRHPSLGLVSPATFIPIAEETGLIVSIGEWALDEACGQARQWQKEGLSTVRVGVNVSALQLEQSSFTEDVMGHLAQHELDAALIELEITESSLMSDPERSIAQLHSLRDRGIRFAIDDFGTGHSSLAYVQNLPVETLKIDRSFVIKIQQASDRPPLLENVIRLAHSLHLRVIAEGVETAAQHHALLAMGCDEGQGYLYSRPLLAHAVIDWDRHRPAHLSQVTQHQQPALV